MDIQLGREDYSPREIQQVLWAAQSKGAFTVSVECHDGHDEEKIPTEQLIEEILALEESQ